jgi:glutamine amidotransferase
MIAIIDYKAGNLTSVVKALTYLNAPEITVTQDPDLVRKASKIVLPGVGHFQATQWLTDRGLTEAVRESVARGTWFLGVCVGLQWLFAGSTEAPATAGLGHFPGACERFPATFEGVDLKSPHVGWNSLEEIFPGSYEDSKLLRGIAPGGFVYYTHSWRAPIVKATGAVTNYGGPFTAAVEQDNVMGVQFHPEKSAAVGLQVLKNFIEL